MRMQVYKKKPVGINFPGLQFLVILCLMIIVQVQWSRRLTVQFVLSQLTFFCHSSVLFFILQFYFFYTVQFFFLRSSFHSSVVFFFMFVSMIEVEGERRKVSFTKALNGVDVKFFFSILFTDKQFWCIC